jgi:cytochrome c biogenesis protein CcdA
MKVMRYIAYGAAILFILFGIAILAGYFIKESVPQQFRIMAGIVLILYGAFRFITTFFKKNQNDIIK